MAFVRGLQAAVASLLLGTGFGHAALGRAKRGAIWLAVFVIAAVVSTQSIWVLPVAVAAAAGAMIDAFVLAFRKHEDPPFRWLQRNTISMFVISLTCLLALRMFVIESFKIPASSMHPTLEIGDHFMVNKLASAEPGDIIVFRYPCNPDRDYVKRMIAKGGDAVEVRCNGVYVNGKAIASSLVENRDKCSYHDYDEHDGRWFARQCSRYRETLGDHSYEVFHDAERPEREARPEKIGDSRDFPSRQMPFPPSCEQSGEMSQSDGQVRGKIVEVKPEDIAGACEPQLRYVVPADHVFVLGDNRNNSNDSRVWGGVPTSAIKGVAVGIWATHRPGEGWGLGKFGPVD